MANEALDSILSRRKRDGTICKKDLPSSLHSNMGYDGKSGLLMKMPASRVYELTGIEIKDEYALLNKLYEADPEHTARPYALVLGGSKKKKPIGYLMEHVKGEDLTYYLQDKQNISDSKNEAIISQIKEAVSAYHGKNLVHGDLYENNIIVLPDNRIKIIDPLPSDGELDRKAETALENLNVYKLVKIIHREPINYDRLKKAQTALSKYLFPNGSY